MRANSIGPPRSAALVIISAAVRTAGKPRSDEGTVFTRDVSLTPPGSSMGWAKRLSQDKTQLRNRNRIQAIAGRFVPDFALTSQVRAAKMNAESARERAKAAVREADRAEAQRLVAAYGRLWRAGAAVADDRAMPQWPARLARGRMQPV
jgi:hypothetical protein